MRKGHGSTKVPGVKLRPAAPTRSNKSDLSLKQPAWSRSLNVDDIDSTEILKSCKKPFVGFVLCTSGISDKANLLRQAVELGAQTSSDLTDMVTHLICEKSGSAKYNYSVEHGIPILFPSWISDAYGKWLAGETIDVMKSTSVHRFPTFYNVRLCLTAINDVQRRKEIRKQLEKNGGTFIEVLGKDSQLTHLLCGPDRGDNADGVGSTAKMQFVVQAGMKNTEKVQLVWEDWFWDCLQFNGIVNEKGYLATGPRPQRRIVREPSLLLLPIASTAEQNQRGPATASSIMDKNLDVEEVANVKRVPEATARLWESMLKNRGFEVKGGKLARSPSKVRASNTASGNSRNSSSPTSSRASKDIAVSSRAESSLSAAFKRTKSFAAKEAAPESAKPAFQRVRSTPVAAFKEASSSATASNSVPHANSVIPDGERNLFAGLQFGALGEARGPKLTEALELRGGAIVAEPGSQVDFIIVRLVGGNDFYFDEKDEARRKKFRTECWIEQCIFEERICAAEEHPAFVPLRIPTPLPAADKLIIHMSGLTASEKTPSVRLIKAIGATVTDQLSRRNTHLICPCGSGPKFNKAQEWRIPVLNLQWLYSTVKAGSIQDINGYLVGTQSPEANTSGDDMMTDITNSDFVQGSSRGKASTGKGSDQSQSSNSPSAGILASHAEQEPAFSDSWTASALLSESAPEHPPTSSPALSSRSHGSRPPTTPSSVRRRTLNEAGAPKAYIISPFTSPTKSKKKQETIPSSATPSPLKLPSKNARSSEQGGSSASRSPVTIPATATGTTSSRTSTLSGESASVLKEAIASLLGKRPSSDDNNESESQVRSSGAEQTHPPQPPTRASKRSKPPPRTRSKLDGESSSGRTFSRTTSIDSALGCTGTGPGSRSGSLVLSGAGSTYPFEFDFALGSGESGNVIESQAELMDTQGTADESMRVTYEDPSQRAEERKLLSLLSGNPVDANAERESIPVNEDGGRGIVDDVPREEEKRPQPKPRRRGRNLVRRASTKVAE